MRTSYCWWNDQSVRSRVVNKLTATKMRITLRMSIGSRKYKIGIYIGGFLLCSFFQSFLYLEDCAGRAKCYIQYWIFTTILLIVRVLYARLAHHVFRIDLVCTGWLVGFILYLDSSEVRATIFDIVDRRFNSCSKTTCHVVYKCSSCQGIFAQTTLRMWV